MAAACVVVVLLLVVVVMVEVMTSMKSSYSRWSCLQKSC